MTSAHRYFIAILISDFLPVVLVGLSTVLVIGFAACAQVGQP